MRPYLLLPLFFVLLSLPLRAAESSHEQAVRDFFKVTNLQASYQKSLQHILDAQVQSNPSMLPFRPVMEKFFAKYLAWDKIEKEYIKLYTDAFTEEEIHQITGFFSTEAGRKWLNTQPDLVVKGNDIPRKALQEHLPELQAMMAAELERLNQAAQPTAPEPADSTTPAAPAAPTKPE